MSNSHCGLVLAEPGASYQPAAQDQWVEVLVDCQGTPQEPQQEVNCIPTNCRLIWRCNRGIF
jgi:hypothetical protein